MTVTYESSDRDVAEVDDAEEVYGKAVGTATVTATADDPNYEGTASFEITVSENLAKIAVHSLTLDGGRIGINFIIDPDESDEDSLCLDPERRKLGVCVS